MINVQTDLTHHKNVNLNLLRFAIKTTLKKLDKKDVDVTLRLSNDQEIQALNKAYRDVDAPTDVLSFTQAYIDPDTNRLYLGDIIISLDRAFEQAPKNNHTLDEECAFLAIHGTLHLLGFDHDLPEEEAKMWSLQDKIFDAVVTGFKEKSQ